jgi:Right handed beta helix region
MKTQWCVIWLGLLVCAGAKEIEVGNDTELRNALGKLKAGTTLKIAPGTYRGGLSVSGVEQLVVEAADPERPPEFVGGTNAWQFSRCDRLVVRNLVCRSQTGNGLNIDDGGERKRPVRGVRIEKVTVLETGPRGNFDAIKCSGLTDLVIEDCRIEGWGGQAIDFVGCHDATIRRCRITGRDGFSQATGPQFKGGSQNVVIEDCVLRNAGQRPIHAGGSTGVDYFRPPGAKYEARNITIRRNVIVGGDCAAAFTGVDGAVFEANVIANPTNWVFRILQETRLEGFPPCRNVVVRGNVIVFRRSGLRTEVNVGDATAPETFRFERNWWFAEDSPQRSRPTLPGEVVKDVHGKDPKLDPQTRLPRAPAALRLLGR